MAPISRRASLARSAATALAVSGGVLLQGCGKRDVTGAAPGAQGALLASPDHPVTRPIKPGNRPIAAGLAPERGATLKVDNWTEYIYKKIVKDFEKKYARYDVKVQISTYGNMDEAVAKLRAGQVDPAAPPEPQLHPHISQVWPVFQNPFYDQQWRYSVPYTAYTTGIAWRVDKVKDDIAKLGTPYDALWDDRYRGKVGILDDYREAISMTLLKNGITDINTGNPDQPTWRSRT